MKPAKGDARRAWFAKYGDLTLCACTDGAEQVRGVGVLAVQLVFSKSRRDQSVWTGHFSIAAHAYATSVVDGCDLPDDAPSGHALRKVVARWVKQNEYSHGFLVPPISAWLLFSRGDVFAASSWLDLVGVPISRAIIQPDLTKSIVCFSLVQKGRKIVNESASKWFLLVHVIVDGCTDGALVRATTPVYLGEAELECRTKAEIAHTAVATSLGRSPCRQVG